MDTNSTPTPDEATSALAAKILRDEAQAIAADEVLTANIGARFAAERSGAIDYYEG